MLIDFSSLSRINILVIGDVMLDQYVWGDVARISPEAPVPVVRVRERTELLGGAGNVASNLAGLECPVTVIGICGDDDTGNRLKKIFDEKLITTCLLVDKKRPTTTKTRIMASNQQLFRLDEEDTRSISSDVLDQLFKAVEKTLPKSQAVVLSDYGKGLFQSKQVCQNIINLCHKHGVPVIVDPKGKDWERYQGATVITPNTAELDMVCQSSVDSDETKLITSAKSIRHTFNINWLLVTRGPHGMCIVGPEEAIFLIPARAREVFDVSGAGDAVVAVLAIGIAAGLTMAEAAEIANTAAGIVVGKIGTQPVTKVELVNSLRMVRSNGTSPYSAKIASQDAAKIQTQSWRTSSEKIVFTNGCFDLLHPGHINLLHQARSFGDRLVVGLNTDASVKRLKGDSRPILSEQDRASILSALSCVDMVVMFDEDTPLKLIENLRPDILVKGADYKPHEVVGHKIVTSFGGKVKLVQLLEGYSTTGIADRMKLNRRRFNE